MDAPAGEGRNASAALVAGAGDALGCGLLLKGLIAGVFPVLAGLVYMGDDADNCFRGMRGSGCIRGLRLRPTLLVAAPWHVLATLRNPPYFAFTLHSGPGQYHGFFWFYFFNEHLLRFLNLRYPRDYNTVPRAAVLAAQSGVAVSVVGLFAGSGKTRLQPRDARRPDADHGLVLDRGGDGLLHLLHDAGVLLDADLSGAG